MATAISPSDSYALSNVREGKPPGRSFEEIVNIVMGRMNDQSALLREMNEIRRRYNGDYVVPLPDLNEAPVLPPLTPTVIANAIDHTAMRAASVMPSIGYPALDPTKDKGRESREWAGKRRKATAAVWHQSRMKLLLRRAYRHLCGYATFSMLVIPDFKKEIPRVVLRDPMTTFPEPKASEDYSEHENLAFVYTKSSTWIRQNYPAARRLVDDERSSLYKLWDCVEWIDEDHIVLGIMGPHENPFGEDGVQRIVGRGMFELARYENKAGMVPGIIPSRVTMDKIASQVSNVVGITDLMAKLMALDIIATEKSIWPDRFIIGRSGTMPQLVGGRWKEGTEGEPNIILDAENIGTLPGAVDPKNTQTIDRLERNARVSAGDVPAFGGETYGSLRTGKGMDSMMDAAVGQRVQELQEIFEAHASELNKGVLGVFNGYWPDRKFVLFSGWSGDVGHVDFTPSVHLAESSENIVSYAIPGADVQGVTVALGQLRGAKAISGRTFREKHPWIADADSEANLVLEEDLEEAMKAALLQRASQGGVPPEDLATIEQFVKEGDDIVQAVLKAQKVAQERQATAPPPPVDPAQVAPPGAQPGLANPGEGQEQPLPPEISPPTDSQQNLRQLMLALRAGGGPSGAMGVRNTAR